MYDASSPIPHLEAYWSEAQDDYSDRMADAAERSKMRARARKEATNNGYAANAIRAFGNHVIGRHGGMLRILPEAGLTREETKILEFQFWNWQRQTKDVEKLRRAVRALMFDGEAFQRFIFECRATSYDLFDGDHFIFHLQSSADSFQRVGHPLVKCLRK